MSLKGFEILWMLLTLEDSPRISLGLLLRFKTRSVNIGKLAESFALRLRQNKEESCQFLGALHRCSRQLRYCFRNRMTLN
ncbi:hypothetical protein ACPOL_6302 [Acidisarcina polymorpha]|uniref:Uncharacterized protein n=1 Tax=Acidisarcina polymorpha TaxID=2211140 RepID=A0A2Z5G975_9BACT|nr:hypothetical protein ACPOL_6302 [Acidisarcina polymorpha]